MFLGTGSAAYGLNVPSLQAIREKRSVIKESGKMNEGRIERATGEPLLRRRHLSLSPNFQFFFSTTLLHVCTNYFFTPTRFFVETR